MQVSPRASVMNSGNSSTASWAFALMWILRAETLTMTLQTADVQMKPTLYCYDRRKIKLHKIVSGYQYIGLTHRCWYNAQSHIIIIIIIIIIHCIQPLFMVLASWEFAQFIWWMQNTDTANELLTLRPSQPIWAASLPRGCWSLQPPSAFIITKSESRYAFYIPIESTQLQ